MAGFKDVFNSGSGKTGGIFDKLPLEHMNTDELRMFTEIIYRCHVRDNPNVPIAGVSLNGEKGIDFHVNIKALDPLSILERKFVMMHEVAHIISEHFLRLRRPESREAWNIATDLIINETLKRHYSKELAPIKENGKEVTVNWQDLVEKGLIIPEELGKPLDECTSEDIFEQLLKHKKGGGKGKKEGEGGGSGVGEGSGEGDPLGEIDRGRFDTHDPNMTPENMSGEMNDAIGDIVRRAKQNGYGKGTGEFVRALEKACKKHFPFDKILEKIIHRSKLCYDRPHRRISVRPFIFPRKHEEKIKVYAAVDVSGSCMNYTEDFLGYIMALPEFEAVYFFDDGIKCIIKKGEECPSKMAGYGGTDLNPVMEEFAKIEAKEAKGFRMNFVVLTDGIIPQLHCGPTQGNVVILTTEQEVHWDGNAQGFRNIKIDPKED